VIAVVGLALSMVLSWLTGPSAITSLLPIVTMIVAGIWARTWLVLPAAYLAVVLVAILLDLGSALIMGTDWWEEQNIEHWPGDASVASKMLGQFFEYLVFGVFFALLSGVGVLIARGVTRLLAGWRHKGPLAA
jgi:hypothetical protein